MVPGITSEAGRGDSRHPCYRGGITAGEDAKLGNPGSRTGGRGHLEISKSGLREDSRTVGASRAGTSLALGVDDEMR